MSGSRQNPNPASGDESTLDALSRTIETLEARIQSLVGRRTPSAAPGAERPAEMPSPALDILARQRILDQERANLKARLAARRAVSSPHEPAVSDAPAAGRSTAAGASGDDDPLHDIAQALVDLRRDFREDFAGGVMRELGRIKDDLGERAPAGPGHDADLVAMREDLGRLADGVEEIVAQSPAGAADGLKADLAELRNLIAGLDGRIDGIGASMSNLPDALKTASSLESRLADLSESLSGLDPTGLRDDLAGLAARIDRMGEMLAAIPQAGSDGAVEDGVRALAAVVDKLARQTEMGRDSVQQQFGLLDDRLDEISRAIVAVGSATPADADNDLIERLEERLAGLARQIDAVAAKPPVEAFVPHFADLASRIDALSASTAPSTYASDDTLEAIDMRLSEIARRLDDTANPTLDADLALKNLERQIAHLTDLITAAPAQAASGSGILESLEPRLAAIEEHLATSDEFVIEAARQAAEAVVEAYQVQGAQGGRVPASDMAAISALAEDLRTLEAMSRSSEEKTARSLTFVHETLLKIAERLETLDAAPARMPAAPVEAPRSARPVTPAMPPMPAEDHIAASGKAQLAAAADRAREAQAAAQPAGQPMRLSPAEAAAQAAHFAARTDVDDAAAREADELSAELPDDLRAVAPQREPARRSLFAGLARRLRPERKEPALGEPAKPRAEVDETPSIDPSEAIELEQIAANQPLEPGSGTPDIKRILQKVREAQAAEARMPAAPARTSSMDKADFIAAARRAAQAAAAEAETIGTDAASRKGKGLGSLLKRQRKPILMAVGAVLLVLLSWPIVSPLVTRDRPAEAVATTQGPKAGPATDQVSDKETAQAKNPSDGQAVASAPATATPTPSAPSATAVEAERLPQVRALDDAAPSDETPVADQAESTPSTSDMGAVIAAPADTPAPTAAEGAAAPAAQASAEPTSAPQTAMPAAAAPEQAAPAPGTAAPASVAATDIPAEIGPQSLRLAAEKGDKLAFFEIASRYTEGRGVDIDLGKAANWYAKAADLGFAPAQYRLANLYEKGSGVERDIDKAQDLYRKAAEQGNASAMHNLAVLYAMGKNGTPDFVEAGKWFQKAADLGVHDSQFNLAILYAQGNGVGRDLGESYKWFAIAGADGDKDAIAKRDQVAAAMKPEELSAARAKVDLWKAKPLDQAANIVKTPADWAGTDTRTASVDMTKAIRNIQGILNNNGFDAGPADGVMGAKTVAAIKAFQASIGQEPTGEVNDALVKELLKRNADGNGNKNG